MENAGQLQCKALGRLEKIHRRKNNEEQWKKQWAEQSEQSEIRASACVCLDPGRQATALRARVAAKWTELICRICG